MASRLREQAGSLELIADWLAAIPDASQDYACVPVPLPLPGTAHGTHAVLL